MPGEASLRMDQYYAHPRNAFWPIMAAAVGFRNDLPYAERVERLRKAGIALWDVIGRCKRTGSLDSSIVGGSEQPNGIADLLEASPGIRLVGHNGSKSWQAFSRHIAPHLSGDVRARIRRVRLPSTSPAHAAMTIDCKRGIWVQALRTGIGKQRAVHPEKVTCAG